MAGSNTNSKAVGRPTAMTKEVIGKLEQAFAYGASDKEACFYAGINPDTLYEYQKKHPEFTERKEALKEQPILAARQKVVQEIKNDVKNAQWYLERKRKDEFSNRSEVEAIHSIDPVDVILKKFGLGKEEGKTNDGQDDGAAESPSAKNS